MLLEDEKYTAFHTKFELLKYKVMPFQLTNAPLTVHRNINWILIQILAIELVINTDIHIDHNNGSVVVAGIDDIVMDSKGSIEKHRQQVGGVFDFSLG